MFPNIVLFEKEISFYQIAALCGVLSSGIFACRNAKKRSILADDMLVLLLISAVGVLAGSHLLYAIVNYEYLFDFLSNLSKITSLEEFFGRFVPIFGGSVYYGGLLGGTVTAYFYLKRKKLPFDGYSDVAAPAIALNHCFGRAGCFLSGCCYGVESPVGFVYSHSLLPDANGVLRFPVQLLESAFNLLLFALLFFLLGKDFFRGRLFALYLLIYAVGRFLLEFLRGDLHRGFWGFLSTSQLISLLLIVVSTAIFISDRFRKHSLPIKSRISSE